MNKLIPLGLAALLVLPASAAFAVPMCDPPIFGIKDSKGRVIITENDVLASLEQRLRANGIDAHNTRLWNGCLQTFVNENGHEVMRFYDPDTLAEVPTD
ncbi:MAG TPA: hypothetical protein VHA07_15095 [Devosia sp.]|nr:hypothetical protein [Devosia sp.]